MDYNNIILSSILTVSGILMIILTMFIEDLAGGYIVIGLGLIVLGVIIHLLGCYNDKKS